jgi:Xaa-Pro dipeptidase
MTHLEATINRMENMTDERLLRTLDRLQTDGLISADPGIVRMLAGHQYDIETGPNVFALPAVVVASRDQGTVLVCSADEAEGSETTITYEGFTVTPIRRIANARRCVESAIERTAGVGARWAVDGASVPAGAVPNVQSSTPADGALAALTAIKGPEDIAAIESAIAICDEGQSAAREATREGATELEVWQHVREAMESHACGRIPILADLVSGHRTADVGGPPSTARIETGGLLLVDLVPRVGGVWGDSCSTFVDGEPTDQQRRAHAAARAALQRGLEMLRPGTRSGDVDAAVRAVMAEDGWEYPHHTGHGVGFAWHEEPRIVPENDTLLEPGMVVALEPGTYTADWGLRVEQVAVVTDSEPRVLSGHSLAVERAAA